MSDSESTTTKEAITVLQRDPVLEALVDEYGDLTIEPADDTFKRLLRSIISQQVSVESATAIRNRVYENFDITPKAILDVSAEELRRVGLSRQKAEYIHNIANAYQQNGYSREYFAEMTDQEVIDEMMQIKGIGIWTAKMYLMFCLGRDDVFPVEDLGIRNGIRALYGDDLTRSEMVELAEQWRPFRSTASRYIWRAIE